MLVSVVRARIGHAMDGGRIGVGMLRSEVLMRITSVDQLTVLRASAVLDQSHVAAARAPQKQSQEAYQDASAPNH
jgi:hypothetical protein